MALVGRRLRTTVALHTAWLSLLWSVIRPMGDESLQNRGTLVHGGSGSPTLARSALVQAQCALCVILNSVFACGGFVSQRPRSQSVVCRHGVSHALWHELRLQLPQLLPRALTHPMSSVAVIIVAMDDFAVCV